ncbi:uncharacterized protein LOC116846789 [Odontomachus brunneus]|uniref:uncharacterized protein LOC116846789 n=1 Tax=Odontomachus brunneus TaxID=486640 RepID=UPI0013F1FD02|nr:uncharacterized protein LOC116846789 [Odontomachus brunneus]
MENASPNFIISFSIRIFATKKHKKVHQTEHAEICTIIAEVLKVKPQRDTRRYNDWQQWIQSRKEFMKLVQERWGRPIDEYVNQVIMWSKSCIVCYQQAELRVCQRCFSVNYCNEHVEIFNRKHGEAKCDQFMLLLNINIETISGNTTDLSYKFLSFVNAKSHFEEMLEFCLEFMIMQKRDLDWIAKDYVLSDYLSEPLTVYSGLKRINLLNVLQESCPVIHIISINSIGRNSAATWEILLHLLPEVLQLIIVLIDPELTYSSKKYELCYWCKMEKRTLYFVTIPVIYYKFINSFEKCNKNPNVIVGFHVKLNESDTWSKSIEMIQNLSCPLLLGFSCKQEAQKSITKIQEVLETNIKPTFNQRNHFGGLAPHRDLDTDDIYFRNEHLLIYDRLY